MRLSSSQYQQLHSALLSAFPSHSSLAQMLRFGMDQSLAEIASGGNLSNAVFSLIEWATAQGRIAELIVSARAANARNPELRVIAAQLQSPPGLAADTTHTRATSCPEDPYTGYERALAELLRRLGRDHPRYDEALIYQQRLSEIIQSTRQLGDTETNRASRAQIIAQLNALATATIGVAFNELV